jgi:hypothetical protein
MNGEQWDSVRANLRTTFDDEVSVGFTSGTTNEPKMFLSTTSERKALRDSHFFPGLDGRNILYLGGAEHGAAPAGDLTPNVTRMPFIVPYFKNTARLLERSGAGAPSIPVFDTLWGTLRRVKELSLYLLRERGRLDDLGVSDIVCSTQMLSPGWRQRLEEWWRAQVTEVYAFSELQMCNSKKCPHCSFYHLPPTCIGEFLDPLDGSQVTDSSRCAVLAVTAFYPFVQLEPRIRYRPGDLVKLAPEPCPIWGECGFEVFGRESLAVRVPGSRILAAGECFDVVSDIPDVAFRSSTAVLADDPMYNECGSPQFVLEESDSGAVLHVELRYEPAVWSSMADVLRKHIAESLGVNSADVIFHGPGGLPGKAYQI